MVRNGSGPAIKTGERQDENQRTTLRTGRDTAEEAYLAFKQKAAIKGAKS